MRWAGLTLLPVLLAAGCLGGTDAPEAADVRQPTGACATAFRDASAPAPTDVASTAVGPDRPGQAAPGAADAALGRLDATLGACESHGDWLAGARTVRSALPGGLDVETALDLLCRGREQPAPCEPVLAPREVEPPTSTAPAGSG